MKIKQQKCFMLTAARGKVISDDDIEALNVEPSQGFLVKTTKSIKCSNGSIQILYILEKEWE